MAKSIMQTDDNRCFVCGKPAVHTHHCIHAPRGARDKADKYGLTVRLCWECHEGSMGVHGTNGAYLDKALQRIAQKAFEIHWGHDKWMEVFGKNYLIDESEDKNERETDISG